jgi:multimeric flavodoxin WrbA
MKILIHDLPEETFAGLPVSDRGITVISDKGKIKNCIGCFGCWLKTPGICALNDGYQNIGQLFAACSELTVVSKCVYGAYSPFVKNVWDRSISYLLPYFVNKNNETHHTMRYDNHFTFTVHFYGDDITPKEKETAEILMRANRVSFNTDPQVFFHQSIDGNLLEKLKEAL